MLPSAPMTWTRRATDADLPALVALFDERDGTRYAADCVARRLGGIAPDLARTVVCEVDGRVAAMSTIVFREFGTTRTRRRVGYWTDLYVGERDRGAALYLPLAKATLAASAEGGAEVVMTANRRRDVWASHLKLGFRIASAVPTRARPVRALGAALRLAFAGSDSFAHEATAFDSVAFAVVDRITNRTRPSIDIRESAADERTIDALLPLAVRDRGRSAGTILDRESLARRFEAPLEGRPYRVLSAYRSGEFVGAAIVRTARRSRFELTVVLELLDGGDPEVFRGLVLAIESFARRANTDVVLVLDGVADQSRLWEQAGYPVTPEWYVLLVAPAERAADRLFGDATSWRFPFAEHDAF